MGIELEENRFLKDFKNRLLKDFKNRFLKNRFLKDFKNRFLNKDHLKNFGFWACGIEFGGEDDTIDNNENNYSGLVNVCITMSVKRGRCEEDELIRIDSGHPQTGVPPLKPIITNLGL
ncbi:hypothetical protein YC2023_032318 [Brassica napus]